ncbi:CBO0543 family protein [Bacillus kwashiorkori]|uniref:CBO0543 family protein n=1 Tax=Bacillus kwashiorkori TaxID=1522318 RepID=UPI0007851188|nr:CBO0543 family protein [Bacillus kwashiorkori]
MKKRTFEYAFLIFTSVVGIFLLPFLIVKRSFKDWLIVYLVSVIGNSLFDRYFVSKGFLQYKIRPFKKKLAIHAPFNYIHYPVMLLYYNQVTLNSKLPAMLLKLLPFVIPQVILETIAAKKTKLITWRKGWSWYHSFVSMSLKLFLCRLIIGFVRIINNRAVATKDS